MKLAAVGALFAALCSAEWSGASVKPSSLLQTRSAPEKPSWARYIILTNPLNGDKELRAFMENHKQLGSLPYMFNFQETNQTWGFYQKRMDEYFACGCPNQWDSMTKTCLPYSNWDTCKFKMGFVWYGQTGLTQNAGHFASWVHDHYVRLIVLTRENCVAKYIDQKRNEQKRKGIAGLLELKPNGVKFFCNHEKQMNDELKAMAKYSHKWMTMSYESIVDPMRRSVVLEQVQDFLQAKRQSMASATEMIRLSSTNSVPISSYVSNWEELSAFFQGTEYAPMLNATIPRDL